MSGATWQSSPPGLGPNCAGRRSSGNQAFTSYNSLVPGVVVRGPAHSLIRRRHRIEVTPGVPPVLSPPPSTRTDTISRTGRDCTHNRGKPTTRLLPYQNSTKTASRFPPELYNIAIAVTFSCTHHSARAHHSARHISQLETPTTPNTYPARALNTQYLSIMSDSTFCSHSKFRKQNNGSPIVYQHKHKSKRSMPYNSTCHAGLQNLQIPTNLTEFKNFFFPKRLMGVSLPGLSDNLARQDGRFYAIPQMS